MFLSWFVAQMFSADGTEGRNLLAVLVPPVLRRYLFREREEVQEGDVRGVEREASFHEGSVRAYKVSKTYSGKVLLAAGTWLFFNAFLACRYTHFCSAKFVVWLSLFSIFKFGGSITCFCWFRCTGLA
jgi:hypothetical protein